LIPLSGVGGTRSDVPPSRSEKNSGEAEVEVEVEATHIRRMALDKVKKTNEVSGLFTCTHLQCLV
jgi:hypothetical protein